MDLAWQPVQSRLQELRQYHKLPISIHRAPFGTHERFIEFFNRARSAPKSYRRPFAGDRRPKCLGLTRRLYFTYSSLHLTSKKVIPSA